MWLKNSIQYHRPMGELFDEGYLNQERLEWAINKAYKTEQQQAAQTLLNHSKFQINTTPARALDQSSNDLAVDITLEQAKATIWPFSINKGQKMGDLVANHQISLKDLGFAIENTYANERVQRAAIALLLERLKQKIQEPTPSVGFLKVSSGGRSYSEKRQLLMHIGLSFFLGVFITLYLVFIVWTIQRFSVAKFMQTSSPLIATPAGIVSLFILLGCLGLFLYLGKYIAKKAELEFDKRLKNYRQGQEGEERVIEVIRQSLDGNWQLFRNVVLPSYKSDIDAVLVGTSGVWILEVKAYSGEHRNIGEQWEFKKGNHWKSADTNPSQQAKRNATQLAAFFKVENIKLWVEPIVVWANLDDSLTVQNPAVKVWTLEHLSDELGNLTGDPIPDASREKIITKLTLLCESKVR
jgi:hypothetical protein